MTVRGAHRTSPARGADVAARLTGPFTATVVTSVVVLLLNVTTGALTARVLGSNGRGELAAITTWIVMGSLICSFGLGEGLEYQQARFPLERPAILTTAIAGVVGVSALTMLVLMIAFPLVLQAQSDRVVADARFFLIGVPAVVGMAFFLNLLSGSQQFYRMNVARMLQPLVFAGMLAALLWAHRLNVTAALSAFFTSYLAAFIASWVAVSRSTRPARASVSVARRGLRYGLRLQGHTLGSLVNARLDVLLLPAFVGTRDVGYYVVAVSASSVVVSLFGNLALVVFPAATGAGPEGRAVIVEKATRLVVAASTTTAALLYVASPFLIRLVYGSEFRDSVTLVRWLLPGTVLWSAAWVLSGGLKAMNRLGGASAAQGVGLIVTVVGLALTVPSVGVVGAAATSSVAYATTFLALVYLVRREPGFSGRRLLSGRLLVGDVRELCTRGRSRVGSFHPQVDLLAAPVPRRAVESPERVP